MASVKRFAQDEPALFKAAQDFVALFADCPDPVVAVARQAKTPNAQIAWTLLGTALFQDRDCSQMKDLLAAFYRAFPEEKLWTLPVPAAAEINRIVEEVFDSDNWSMFEHVAGIFWSVGLFARRHPDLVSWTAERSPEEMWRDMGEIYFMGKSKPRPKASAAIYRILAPAPLGLGVHCRDSRRMPPLPLTMGARRYLAILGPAKDDGFADLSAEDKQKLANACFKALCPENPYAAAHSMQFFLEDCAEGFICRKWTNRCAKCPFYEYCNYAENQGGRKYEN